MGFSRQEYWSGVPLPSPSCSTTHIQTRELTIVAKDKSSGSYLNDWILEQCVLTGCLKRDYGSRLPSWRLTGPTPASPTSPLCLTTQVCWPPFYFQRLQTLGCSGASVFTVPSAWNVLLPDLCSLLPFHLSNLSSDHLIEV